MVLVEDLESDIINWGDIEPIAVVDLPLDYSAVSYSRFELLSN